MREYAFRSFTARKSNYGYVMLKLKMLIAQKPRGSCRATGLPNFNEPIKLYRAAHVHHREW